MSNATIKDIMYLFKYHNFVIWSHNGDSATRVMSWDECWKYCREENLLKIIPRRCYISMMSDCCIDINL